MGGYWRTVATRAAKEAAKDVKLDTPVGVVIGFAVQAIISLAIWVLVGLTDGALWVRVVTTFTPFLTYPLAFLLRAFTVPAAIHTDIERQLAETKTLYEEAWTPVPDWPIRDLFLHIDPSIFEDIERELWRNVGRRVLDALSTGRLRSWGRQNEGPDEVGNLVEIPCEYWGDASFTYCFMSEPNDGSDDTTSMSRGLDYADVQFSRAQALRIWP